MMMIVMLSVSLLLNVGLVLATQAGDNTLPKDMAYIAYGPSIMGIDKPESNKKPDRNPSSLYEKRVKGPWSAEAFHDEGPAHIVVLDAYLMDMYEVSNEWYRTFINATGHPAPAYWDDPRLNKSQQP